MLKSALYCIVLLPDTDQREEVRRLKEEMKNEFGAKHALKSPAHITLQMPFRRNLESEPAIIEALSEFASQQTPFKVHLHGFGCFAPKVIFVKIEDHKPVIELHAGLIGVLENEIGLSPKEIISKVFPHMTIATRDLTKEAFREAWPHFEKRNFNGTFEADSIYLLKHNGRNWEIFKQFRFDG